MTFLTLPALAQTHKATAKPTETVKTTEAAKAVPDTPGLPEMYDPSELQKAQLLNAQKDVVITEKDENSAKEHVQTAHYLLYQAAEKVKQDNGWPKELQFDIQKLVFFMPPPPPEPKKDAVPAPEKK